MPIEREFKYLLRNHPELEDHVRQQASSASFFEQGYLVGGGRVRRVQHLDAKDRPCHSPQFIFTYKHDLSNDLGVMEIETEISEADFNKLWLDTQARLYKRRRYIEHAFYTWEVDFLFDEKSEPFMIIAECEVEPGEAEPKDLPGVITRNLMYAVPDDDDRFTSHKLADRRYARLLLELVEAGHIARN